MRRHATGMVECGPDRMQNGSEWPETAPAAFAKFAFAGGKLLPVAPGLPLNRLCNPSQPGFIPPGAPVIARMALVIGQVEAVGVILGDAAADVAEVAVPSDKVDGITEIIPIREGVAGLVLVVVPGGIEGLGIAVCRRWSWTRKDIEAGGAGRFGIGIESRFPVDDGHHHGNRDLPPVAGGCGIVIPFGPLPENLTDVPGALGRMGCAAYGRQEEQSDGESDQWVFYGPFHDPRIIARLGGRCQILNFRVQSLGFMVSGICRATTSPLAQTFPPADRVDSTTTFFPLISLILPRISSGPSMGVGLR